MVRQIAIVANQLPRAVEPYLPGNYSAFAYQVPGVPTSGTAIIGNDSCGWTLEDYVIPRLASGLYFAKNLGSFDHEDYKSYQLDDPADLGLIVNELS